MQINKKLNKNKAFTLVELIVVITILAILGTIAFISFQGYSRDSRDSVRISDMNNIEKAMELMLLKGSPLPKPEESVNILASGSIIGYQGIAGEDTLSKIGVNNGGKDPLDDRYYTYVTTKDLNKYQILGYLEQDTTSNNLNLFNGLYALDYSSRFPVVKGNNLGVILNTGSLEPINTDIDIVLTNTIYEAILNNDVDGKVSGTGSELVKVKYNSNCKRLKEIYGIKNDGVYKINPTGLNEINAYCDMTTDGGGWTMIAHAIGEGTSVFNYNDIVSWTPKNSDNCNLEEECLSESGLYIENWDELMVYTRGYKVKGIDCNDKNLSIKGYSDLPVLSNFNGYLTNWEDTTRGAHGKCGELSELSSGKIVSKISTHNDPWPIHMGIKYTSNDGTHETALLFFGPTYIPQGLGTKRSSSTGKIKNHYNNPGLSNDKLAQANDWDGASTQEQTWFIR